MQKSYSILLLILFLLIALPVRAEEEAPAVSDPAIDTKISPEMLEILNANIDNIFPITSVKDYFNKPAAAVYKDNGPETVIEIENDRGRRNLRLFVNADGIHDRIGYEAIDSAYPKDFHMTMNVVINDAWPPLGAGCFIGFTNYGVSAFHGSDGAAVIALVSDGNRMEIYTKNLDEDTGKRYPLEAFIRTSGRLTIAHLTGQTYVYVNGAYSGQLHDGLQGPFRLIYGALTSPDGDSASCSFDNLVIRKVSNKQ